MQINQETRDRITVAADQLFNDAGRANFPTVDAVRRMSKTNMNDASAVMKDWRRMQTATAAPVAVAVPERVQHASQAALAAMWSEAQEIANESLKAAQVAWDVERGEAETLRDELSTAFEAQAAELDLAQRKLGELEACMTSAEQQAADLRRQLAGATERAGTAEARAVEIEKRADDLKAAVTAAQEAAKATVDELEAERQRHGADAARLDAALSELAMVKAKAQADQEQHTEQRERAAEEAHRTTERMSKVEAERDAARKETAETREAAASLRGQLDATTSQNAALLAALTPAQPVPPSK